MTLGAQGMRVRTSGSVPKESRLVVVSNRGPIEHYFDDKGRIQRRLAGGGVATALSSAADVLPFSWVASAHTPADRAIVDKGAAIRLGHGMTLRLVTSPSDSFDPFYNTFCNPLLWFVQHSLIRELEARDVDAEAMHAWEQGYLPVNQAIAEAVVQEIRKYGSCKGIMLHDYHFYAAPLFIRNLFPHVPLQHFIHIPWPGIDVWQHLPRPIVDSIHEGLLANDSIVFQTESSAQEFLLTCWAFVPEARIDFSEGTVTCRGRRTRVWANPISVNPSVLRLRALSPEGIWYLKRLQRETGERTIVRVDRMDPSKNILAGFEAFDLLLRQHPELIGRAKFLAFLVPSRTAVAEYRDYSERVFRLIEEVNSRHGRPGWTPIKLFYEQNRVQALAALSLYDVLLVNSLADGMNLVAKEGPAVNRRDGVLVLSVAAGAFEELHEGAIGVRPDDVADTARALHEALSLSPGEKRERAFRLRRALLRHDLNRWLYLQLEDLERIENERSAQSESAERSWAHAVR